MNLRIAIYNCLLVIVASLSCNNNHPAEIGKKDFISNPVDTGFYADPTIIKYNDKYIIYATIDPWGGKELGVLITKDFKHFTRAHLNWPTKEACTSKTSNSNMVWAPSVVKAADGKYYMYVSVGSEVWAGVSERPLGPWQNVKADNSPLVAATDFPNVHNIDADCFIDDNGDAYLYWGSGFNWVNGHCMAAKLDKNMAAFATKPVDITPPNYFEAPHMFKRDNEYYLMYSNGKAIDASYNICYSVSSTPFGPWKEGLYDPILSTSEDSSVYGPGHNTTFKAGKQYYILYHKIHPQKNEFVLRQLCIDSLNFDKQGNILPMHGSGVYNFTKYN